MKRIAFYGGSFDPVHNGHVTIANALLEQFGLDEFVFIPAYHAPHKSERKPTSAYDRFAMLCLVTRDVPKMFVSRMELEMPERPYSVETLTRLSETHLRDEIYFVMGADSWNEITLWREWEKVLRLTNHIVMTRPGDDLNFSHVTDDVRSRIVDLRSTLGNASEPLSTNQPPRERRIFITDRVNMDVSATSIRKLARQNDSRWRELVPAEVAIYIEKYQIYN